MRFIVKYEVNQYKIYDNEKRLASWIRRPVFTGNYLDVYDVKGSRRYHIVREEGEIVVEKEGADSLHGILEYSAQSAYTRPPMAEKTVLHTQSGKLTICQAGHRDFSVWLDQKKVGEMTHMQSIIKEVLLSDNLPEEYCGLCFAVGFLMLHDDDIEMV